MGLSMTENASEKSVQQLEELAVENIIHIEILLVSRVSSSEKSLQFKILHI